jgi:hypothetical protein
MHKRLKKVKRGYWDILRNKVIARSEATKCRFTASRTSGQSPVKQGDCFGEERLAMTLDPK